MHVPDEIAIVGFDNIELSGAHPYQITTNDQPHDEMISTLVDMIVGRKPKKPVVFPGHLVVRQSTR